MKNKLLNWNIRIVFQTKCKLINFFTFKEKNPLALFINASVLATTLPFMTKLFKVFSALSEKTAKGDNNSTIKEHNLFCIHSSDFDDFSILASNSNDFKVTFTKSILVNRYYPPLNKNRHLVVWKLFDDWAAILWYDSWRRLIWL